MSDNDQAVERQVEGLLVYHLVPVGPGTGRRRGLRALWDRLFVWSGQVDNRQKTARLVGVCFLATTAPNRPAKRKAGLKYQGGIKSRRVGT
jgi:hypothetical protein